MNSRIRYDDSFLWEPQSSGGLPSTSRVAVMQEAARARKAVLARPPGFFAIPELTAELRETRRLAAETARRFRTLLVVGIGGSDLGARALIAALGEPVKGMEVRFLGANTDPDEIASTLQGIDLRKTCVNVISKSGDTVEPMATFLILRARLEARVGRMKAARHIVATTDREKGALRALAAREGYRTLPVPGSIGGRFSVLTTVGLFPAACAGIDVRALVRGAKEELETFHKGVGAGAAGYAAALVAAGAHGRDIDVLMPYSSSLHPFALWYRQLWAESLGKLRDRAGRTVRRGLTPIAALGATDQHSQIQLYNEGPEDKVVTFIDVKRPRQEIRVPRHDVPELRYLAGKGLHAILRAEREATAQALAESGQPSATLGIERVDAATVGGMMAWFMLATACAAELLDVDAYDQPGVERGKAIMREMLSREP